MAEPSLATLPLQIETVTKRFRQGSSTVEALRDISLTIHPGEFVAVMGASGSGKSTLLHVTAGLTIPEEGRVVVEGQDLTAMAARSDRLLTQFRRRRIGLVFQAFNLIPTLTAEQNILLPLLADGRAPDNSGRIDKLIQRLGLASRRHHRPDAMSGGEQQRVAIARALVADPAVVLADEPTGSLDSVSGQQLCQLLREQNEKRKTTIVVVTHEPHVAIWASRVILLRDGRILDEFETRHFEDSHSLATHYHEVVDIASAAEVA